LGSEAVLAWIEEQAGYGEVRMVTLTPIGDMLYFEAFVDRVMATRIISLRRANSREVSHYVQAIQDDQSEDANT
jgi:uncharacterized DUF497 family protein